MTTCTVVFLTSTEMVKFFGPCDWLKLWRHAASKYTCSRFKFLNLGSMNDKGIQRGYGTLILETKEVLKHVESKGKTHKQ